MPSLRTPLCDLLGIEYPILSAGFGSGAGPEVVAAVSNAGGLGVLGMSGQEAETIRRMIARTRELTERPFGVNVIIAELEEPDSAQEDRQFVRDEVTAGAQEEVDAIVLFWGPADEFVEEAHRQGIKLLIQVGSVEEASKAAEAGVDAVIAQGFEAGGHVRGTQSVWELLPATVEAIDPIPVLASGGIGDGKGVARAVELGAQGVSLGTRFVASDEAWVHPLYKQKIVEAKAEDTVYSDLYHEWWPNAPHRVLHNRLFEEWEAAGRPPAGGRPGEGTTIGTRRSLDGELFEWPRYAVGVITPDFEGDFDLAPMWAGESVAVVNDIKPAGEIVRELVRDAEAALAG
jgi:nitronate monooxygenase